LVTAPADGMTADARAAVDELMSLRGQPIALIPATGTVTEKPGGGKDYGPGAARGPQIIAMFNKGALDGVEEGQTDRGTNRKFQYEGVMFPDALVAIGDHWEDDIASYTVEVIDRRSYQTTLSVVAFLKTPGHGFG
jgi:hypothetical protein